MLVLSRKLNEEIHIGEDIVIRLVQIRPNQVRLAIQAPEAVKILRGELSFQAETASAREAQSLT